MTKNRADKARIIFYDIKSKKKGSLNLDTNTPQKKNDGGFLVRFINKIIDAVLKALHLTKYKEQIMYLFVGGGTTVVDWIIFTALVFLLPDLSQLPFFSSFPNAIEYTVAWAGAVLFAYWASKFFVFESAKKEGFSQFLRFVASRVLTLLLSLAGDFILTGLLEINEFIAKLIISVAVVIINYITSKLLVFNKKENED